MTTITTTDPGGVVAARTDGPPSGAEEVAARLKTTFGYAYLTLTGVTQSVALAVLAARVESGADQFDLVNWVLAINTFLLIVLVWNEYLIASIAYVWTPTIADALIPFSLLGVQLLLAHNVSSERSWLSAMAAFLAVGTAAFAYGFFLANRHPDNRELLAAIGIHQSLTMVFTGVGCVLCVAGALLYDWLDLGDARALTALAATAMIVATLARSVPYWNRITGYSRTGGCRT